MKASEAQLLRFLRESKVFEVPIYQRMYTWSTDQCERLWSDIVEITQDTTNDGGHFIGSLVYIESGQFQINRWVLDLVENFHIQKTPLPLKYI